ncbi:PadR family transcriptional regulator [Streptomyces jumonjinensis]|uniref:PadR family transcriptional regulator n=1 Tax=Streptomyces jumonjinensis TaxID=1945 RepID=A0A646KQP1_STRJU|nr:PadR family transcriptional regulator [Streptomyces jumonjinensis]MQT04649.1 PadR family transcriptional regulator [Streptomyces jumonjinensis]
MPPVFAHGRLRLYLLKLLDEAPRHGYEVIRLLEERFHGLYAPSAGTVYPRLAKLEAEGLVTHATEGGRKVYSITDAGREELAGRSGELADLEVEIRESVSELAAEIRDDVRGAAGKLRSEMRAAASRTRTTPRAENEEWRKVTHEWQEQARRAREEAQQARRQAKEAQDSARHEMQRIAKQVQDQVQDHFTRGDWPTGVREGLSELTAQLSGLAKHGMSWPPKPDPSGPTPPAPSTTPDPSDAPEAPAPDPVAEWPRDLARTGDPARDLDRLLDRFRDDIRDAARDHGVTETQLAEARRHLSSAAAHIAAALHTGDRK